MASEYDARALSFAAPETCDQVTVIVPEDRVEASGNMWPKHAHHDSGKRKAPKRHDERRRPGELYKPLVEG
jgi:hypothetical protein